MEPRWLHSHLVMPFSCIQGLFMLPLKGSDKDLQAFLGEGTGGAPCLLPGLRALDLGSLPAWLERAPSPGLCQQEDVEQSQLCAANINYPLTALQAAIRSQLSDSCSQPEGCSGGGAAGRWWGAAMGGVPTLPCPQGWLSHRGQGGFGCWHCSFRVKYSHSSVWRVRSSPQLSSPAPGG